MEATRVKWIYAALTALLACAAQADPRAAQTMGAEPVPDTPMQAWLGRMVDRFKFEGTIHVVNMGDCDGTNGACVTVQGKADCVLVGEGPGLHCVLDARWQEIWDIVFQKSDAEGGLVDDSPTGVFEVPGGVPYLDPAMALFGIDPGESGINYLLVNNKGMPEGGIGHIKGNQAIFVTRCVNGPALLAAMKPVDINGRKPDTCYRKIILEAKPDSKVVWMTIQIDINDDVFTRFTLTMRRQPTANGGN